MRKLSLVSPLPFSSLPLLLLLLIAPNPCTSKRFTIKGEPLWPSQEQIFSLTSSLQGTLFQNTDRGYSPPSTFNIRAGPPLPTIVVTPANDEDIVRTLQFARDHVIRIVVHSTGMDQEQRSTTDHGIVLRMEHYNHKEINVEGRTLTVGPGQTFAEIASFVQEQTDGGLVPLYPLNPAVGPAGYVLGGGYGYLTRLHGYGVDSLLSLDVILANGTKVNTNFFPSFLHLR